MLTSAPAFATSAAMSLLPCLAAQCRAVCVRQDSQSPSVVPLSGGTCWSIITSCRGQKASCSQRQRTDGGMVRRRNEGMEGWFPAIEHGLITKQHSTVPTVGGPCCLSPGGRLMMLVWPAEGRPTQTSPNYCQHTSGRETHTDTPTC